METLKEIISTLKIVGISIAGITFIVLMIKMAIEPEMKQRYIKLTKHLLIATVFITISLSLVDIPKKYYGDKIAIVDEKKAESTIADLKDADCQGRETILFEGSWYVVTDSGMRVGGINDYDSLDDITNIGFYDTGKVVENVCFLRRFSECQGFFKGYFAETVFYRDSDGVIFPRWYTYPEYINLKNNLSQDNSEEE